jgi:inorganic pyrophosphatase
VAAGIGVGVAVTGKTLRDRQMTNLLKLPTWADDEHVFAVVETPRGSTCKLDFDADLRAFTLTKPLMTGLTYPYDWGFIPSTEAEDGDPLDVLIILEPQTYPGVILRCRPVGILEVEQKKKGETERNDRIFAVPDRSPLETDFTRYPPPSVARQRELEEFFSSHECTGRQGAQVFRVHGPARAIKAIRRLSSHFLS